MRNIIILILLISWSLLAGGCSVYKVDVQQGNTLEPNKIAQLRTGMTAQQVNFLLGTPLIEDPFRSDRWDYVYSLTPGGQPMQVQRLTLYFDNDRLVRIDDQTGARTE